MEDEFIANNMIIYIKKYYEIEQRWIKEIKDEQNRKRKVKDMRMNISFFLLFKSKQMVWIYTSSTLIIGLTKERKNQ